MGGIAMWVHRAGKDPRYVEGEGDFHMPACPHSCIAQQEGAPAASCTRESGHPQGPQQWEATAVDTHSCLVPVQAPPAICTSIAALPSFTILSGGHLPRKSRKAGQQRRCACSQQGGAAGDEHQSDWREVLQVDAFTAERCSPYQVMTWHTVGVLQWPPLCAHWYVAELVLVLRMGPRSFPPRENTTTDTSCDLHRHCCLAFFYYLIRWPSPKKVEEGRSAVPVQFHNKNGAVVTSTTVVVLRGPAACVLAAMLQGNFLLALVGPSLSRQNTNSTFSPVRCGPLGSRRTAGAPAGELSLWLWQEHAPPSAPQ
jgi:hypothetical protein